MRLVIHAVLLVAAFGLAGCYVGKTALITPETADYPVAHRTHFDGFLPRGTGWRPQGGRALGVVDKYYVYIEDGETERSVPFLMKRIAPGRYIIQINDSSDSARITEYYYGLVDFDGKTAIQYQPSCVPLQAWIDQKLIESAERTSTNTRCLFKTFENLSTVLQAAAKNAPPEAKFVVTAPPAGQRQPLPR